MDVYFFEQPLIVPIKESGDLYELCEDYIFIIYRNEVAHKIVIRKGFKYDGASVPKFFAGIVGFMPDGIHRPAALLHDYLYEHKGKLQPIGGFNYTRKEADKLFYKILKKVGVKSWHAKLAYWAVRLGGGLYWNDK